MNSKTVRTSLRVALFCAGAAWAGCGDDSVDMETPPDPPVPMETHPPEPDACSSGNFCFGPMFGSELGPMTLGSQATINTSVVLSNSLAGQTINFTAKTNLVANKGDFVIAVSPGIFASPAGGENVAIKVTLQATTRSADYTGKTLGVHAEVAGMPGLTGDSQTVPLTLMPTVLVEYSGKGGIGTPHTWTIQGTGELDIGAAGQQAPTIIKLRPQGVVMSFINKDQTASHILHCSGVIPHQDTNKPTPPGKSYDVKIATAGNASCYDHNIESQSVAVYFTFIN